MTTQSRSASPAETEELDVTRSAATSTADDESTSASSAETEQDTETLQDVIEKAWPKDDSDGEGETDDTAAKDDDEPESEPAGDSDQDKGKESDKADETEQEEDDDDGSDVEEGQRVPYQRFRKIIGQRDEYKQKFTELERQATEYKTGYENHQAIQKYMQANNLQTPDMVDAMEIAALVNRDPAAALQRLQPLYQKLQQYVGEVLPSDLQNQVDNGELTEQAARELVRSRNESERLRQQHAQSQQRQQKEAQQQRATQVQSAMAETANRVQQEIMEKDPDYEMKADFVRRELQVLIQEQRPRTAAEADKLVRQAHKTVTDRMKRLKPRQQIRPGPSSTETGTSKPAPREPETMADAINMRLNGEW